MRIEDKHVLAARLIAANFPITSTTGNREAVDVLVGVNERNIRAWRKRPEFEQLVQRFKVDRETALGHAPDYPTVLTEALAARKDDRIDWSSRLRAAQLLAEHDRGAGEPTADAELPFDIPSIPEGCRYVITIDDKGETSYTMVYPLPDESGSEGATADGEAPASDAPDAPADEL
jgi:hypothetical protein